MTTCQRCERESMVLARIRYWKDGEPWMTGRLCVLCRCDARRVFRRKGFKIEGLVVA